MQSPPLLVHWPNIAVERDAPPKSAAPRPSPLRWALFWARGRKGNPPISRDKAGLKKGRLSIGTMMQDTIPIPEFNLFVNEIVDWR